MGKTTETVLEINFNHLKHNFEYLKSKLNPKTKFLAVVKAFAYGNDAITVAQWLQKLKVDYFAVAYANEGIALRRSGITLPILVLHPQASNLKAIINASLEPNLYNASILNSFITIVKQEKLSNYPVHIEFNTGLNRLGFWENDIDFILSKLNDNRTIKIESLFSHLAASEDKNENNFSHNQINAFKTIAQQFISKNAYKPMIHICNTSGVFNFPEAHLDMVRCGIGLYGFGNSKSENKNLKPIAALKSIISQIHHIKPHETVGYNRAFKASSFAKIATIPIGHADGIGRHFGNGKGFVFIHNKKARIVGNVCMDMLMVDVNHIECREGDEAVFFNHMHSAEDLAKSAGTISYELITAISQRVKRKIVM